MTAEWTAEEEAVARLVDPIAWSDGDPSNPFARRNLGAQLNSLIVARRVIAAMQPRWRDVRTDPPPRDGTRMLLWNAASKKAHIGEWDEDDNCWGDGNGSRIKHVTHWQPIIPPLPTAPEDRT